jgi:hypothetical protein
MKETAVEWLVDDLIHKGIDLKHYQIIIGIAKEMEREQIKNAWLNSLTKGDYNSADEYYNETFNNKA